MPVNAQGYQVDDQGDLLSGQMTPGMRDNAGGLQYDEAKDLFFTIQNGQKAYVSPTAFAGAEGSTSTAKGTGHGMLATVDKGGGAFHGQPTWNQQTGTFDVDFDWGKIGSMIVAGVLTAGALDAAFGAGTGAQATTAASTQSGSAGAGDVAAGVLPSTTTASPVASAPAYGNLTGNMTAGVVTGVVPGAASGVGGTLSKIGGLSNALRGSGVAIGEAAVSSGENALDREKLALDANAQNITGQNAFNNELLARAAAESSQRNQGLKDMYKASYAANPRVSPFDPVGPPKFSPAFMAALSNVSNQDAAMLAKPPTYSVPDLPKLNPYQPVPITNVQGATNTQPGTLTKVGSFLGPALTVGGYLTKLFGG